MALAMGLNTGLWAQPSLTADEAVSKALAGNLELAADRIRIEEAGARWRQSGLWPNPELEIEGRSDQAFNNEGEESMAAHLSQPFSLSGRIGARKMVARVETQQVMAEVAEHERQIVGAVRRACTEWLAAEEELKLQDLLKGLNGELLSATQAAQEHGQVSEKDVNAIQIAWQQSRQRLRLLESGLSSRRLELNTLMGEPPDHEFLTAGRLDYQPPGDRAVFSLEQSLARRPDYALAKSAVEWAQAGQRLARSERLEDWRVAAGYEREQSVVDGAPPQSVDQFVGVRLTVSLPLFDRQQGRIGETAARLRRAEQAVEALRLQIGRELADAGQRVRTLAPLLAAYTPEILKRAEDNMKLVETSYRQGLVGMVEVIQSRQQFAELRSLYIETLRDYQLAVIELDLAAGVFPCDIPFRQSNEVTHP